MCWSGEASAVLATVGAASTGYAAYKKEPAPLWIVLGYFTLMEALQAFTYTVIDDCSAPSNQVATLLGYLHITFQPFFINTISLYFVPERIRRKCYPWVYAGCFVAAIVMLIQLYPFDWAGQCNPERPLCGQPLCSRYGNWHIAWYVPANGIGNSIVDYTWILGTSGYPAYVIASFWLPMIYGSWRFTLYHMIMGPLAAMAMTDDINEWPAIWCLLSIGFLLIVVKTPIRAILHVRRWVWWSEPPKAASTEGQDTKDPDQDE